MFLNVLFFQVPTDRIEILSSSRVVKGGGQQGPGPTLTKRSNKKEPIRSHPTLALVFLTINMILLFFNDLKRSPVLYKAENIFRNMI